MNERRFVWLMMIYNCEYTKDGGDLSEFERVLGFTKQNQIVREFLKYLIEKEALLLKEYKRVNNNSIPTYCIDKKRLFEIIQEQKLYFKNLMKMVNDKYLVAGDWTT